MILINKNIFLLLLLIFLSSSCSKFSQWFAKKEPVTTVKPPQAQKIASWDVETFYIIQDIYPELGDRIVSKIANQVLQNSKAIRKLPPSEIEKITGFRGGYGFAIHPKEVSTLSKLSRIQQVIIDISEKEVVPVQLVSNILNFQSVSGDAAAFTAIYGDASPGSIVDIDDGSGKLVSVLTKNTGEWDAQIRQNEELRRRRGYVYIKMSKGDAVQFLRMDVLSKQRKRITKADLPRNSILLNERM